MTLKPGLIQLDIEFDGTPRSLAQIAGILDKVNVTILSSTSRRPPRATTTRWTIDADLTPSPYGLRELHTTLLQLPEILSVSIAATARGRLHL
jgi:hypothetical protein